MMLFDTFKELDRISSAFAGLSEPAVSSMPVNVYRDGDRFVVEADLPGFDPSSIDVSAQAGLLTISAERDVSREDRGEHWLIRERGSARVVRQIALGDEVDLDGIAADYRDGVLKIALPLRADALPRKVAIAGLAAPAQPATAPAAASGEVADPKAQPAHSVAS